MIGTVEYPIFDDTDDDYFNSILKHSDHVPPHS